MTPSLQFSRLVIPEFLSTKCKFYKSQKSDRAALLLIQLLRVISSKNNVIGLLFVKDLIFIDPEDETPIRSFIQIFGRGVHVVWPIDKLGDVLRELKQGRSHLALVRDVVSNGETDPYYVIKGIITLEGRSAR